ncbi:MAG TPA: Crp/Fnr family transcriptional regulator [Candidatus Acidoferrum sp.]|nr:Crp/Fnr family transcriptional regulator [Candidatus Acidoferrum sp.]
MTHRIWFVSTPEQRRGRTGGTVRAPYGLQIVESCLSCVHREERLFCNLPPEGVQKLAEIVAPSTYPKGATLFVEGQEPRGVFILCSGKVKLSTSSADGKTLILRISETGEVLGLAATVCGKPYQATAEILEPSQVNFISRNDFLAFLKECGEATLRVAQQLGENYHHALSEMKTIGLSHSAGEKLARFLLDWCAEHATGNGEPRVKLTLTHQEIAQLIGTSRETVTRLFADFKKRQLVQVKGSTIIFRDKTGLQRLLAQ